MAKKENTQKKKKGKSRFKAWAQGRSFLTLQFFKHNIWYVLAIIVMLLMNISLKYMCQERLQEVIKLTTELDDVKTDCVNACARYNSKIRESEMKALIDTNHIQLELPEQPPFKITEK